MGAKSSLMLEKTHTLISHTKHSPFAEHCIERARMFKHITQHAAGARSDDSCRVAEHVDEQLVVT